MCPEGWIDPEFAYDFWALNVPRGFIWLFPEWKHIVIQKEVYDIPQQMDVPFLGCL